ILHARDTGEGGSAFPAPDIVVPDQPRAENRHHATRTRLEERAQAANLPAGMLLATTALPVLVPWCIDLASPRESQSTRLLPDRCNVARCCRCLAAATTSPRPPPAFPRTILALTAPGAPRQ